MARQDLTSDILEALGTDKSLYTAGAADLTMTAADPTNKEEFALTGDEIIIAYNSDAGAQTVTITSVEDYLGRDGDIETYSIGAGEFAVFGPFGLEGWRQTDGNLYLEASDATVKIGVIRI